MAILQEKQNRFRRIGATLLTCVLLLGTLAGCETASETVPDQSTVRIGVFEPLTGEQAAEAAEEIRGIELAHKLHDSVLGKPVELVYSDNGASAKQGKEAASKLLSAGISAAIGSYGNVVTLAAADLFRDAEVPLINATGTNPLLAGSNSYLLRVATEETDQGTAAAAYLTENLGLTKAAALVALNDDYAVAMAENFATAMGNDVKVVSYLSGTEDFSTEIHALHSCHIEALYLTGTAEDMSRFITQARMSGEENWVFIGTERLKDESYQKNLYSWNSFVTGGYDPQVEYTEEAKRFLTLYRLHYGEDAVPTEAEALGYEAYLLALAGIEEAGSTEGKAVQRALYRLHDLAGVTGFISVTEEGKLSRPVTVWRISHGVRINAFAPSSEEGL